VTSNRQSDNYFEILAWEKNSLLPNMSDNEGPHTDPDQPAVDHYGNLKDASLLELDVSPDTLAAKARLVADAFPQNLGHKPNHGLSYDSGDEDSDEDLHTSVGNQPKRPIKKVAPKNTLSHKNICRVSATKKPAQVRTAFAAFGINPNNLKTLGAGEPIILRRNHNAKEKVSGLQTQVKVSTVNMANNGKMLTITVATGKQVENSWSLRSGKRKATGPSKSSSDTATLSEESLGGQQATKKQHINDINSDTDNGSHTQDDEVAEFAAADKASTALILANHPKRTDATHDLDGMFGKPEVHKNPDKQVDELMWACLVCM
jgi:hypothetical protein